jgi:ABC-type dipeptide/oligopeptide/nickel transport system permease component
VVRVMGLIGYSVPIFWLGLMALVLFYAKLGWVAGPGRIDVTMNTRCTRDRPSCCWTPHWAVSGRRFATRCRT